MIDREVVVVRPAAAVHAAIRVAAVDVAVHLQLGVLDVDRAAHVEQAATLDVAEGLGVVVAGRARQARHVEADAREDPRRRRGDVHSGHALARDLDAAAGLDETRQAAARRVVEAMTACPEMVAGPGRFTTRLMDVTMQSFTKFSDRMMSTTEAAMVGSSSPPLPWPLAVGAAATIAAARVQTVTADGIRNRDMVHSSSPWTDGGAGRAAGRPTP